MSENAIMRAALLEIARMPDYWHVRATAPRIARRALAACPPSASSEGQQKTRRDSAPIRRAASRASTTGTEPRE